MKIAVFNESSATERRVALVPDDIIKLRAAHAGLAVVVQSGAGQQAGFADAAYTAAGATIATQPEADILLRLTPPAADTLKNATDNALIVGTINPWGNAEVLAQAAKKNIHVLAMEKLPRTSRAQAMDILSSQANIAGYRAVIEAVSHYNRYVPLMMTSAGSAKPARMMVLGVGVAGLQAIATARRLGAQVEAFDIRPETREQVQSLGAKFIDVPQEQFQDYLKAADIIITTAQVLGKKPPVLVQEATVLGMRNGSVIVDMAAQEKGGGNCPLTRKDEVLMTENGVTLVGNSNYPAMVAHDASRFYSRNLCNLLQLLLETKDNVTALKLDMTDDLIAATLVVHNGEVKV
ncbi:MAG: NAD(P)(+) transhydrogenase (Re/Si-specific) subunit alpha [Alphaproteobacteria bacterium]